MNPDTYWQPWLAHWFGIQKRDMGELTYGEMLGCLEFATQKDD